MGEMYAHARACAPWIFFLPCFYFFLFVSPFFILFFSFVASCRVIKDAQKAAAAADRWLRPSSAGAIETEGLERTWQLSQESLAGAAEVGAANKAFDLSLPELGPYALDVSRDGRLCLLGGRAGHLALFDRLERSLVTQLHVREEVRAVRLLHNDSFFAAAQKEHTFIYDRDGVEVHRLDRHVRACGLDFLPHHFLLVSAGAGPGGRGEICWQDTSTGKVVAVVPRPETRGRPQCLRSSAATGVSAVGGAGGVVTLWMPSIGEPVAQLLAHHGPVRAVAWSRDGRALATAGADRRVRVWDVRTWKALGACDLPAPPTDLDVSQRGMVAVGFSRTVRIWQDFSLTTKGGREGHETNETPRKTNGEREGEGEDGEDDDDGLSKRAVASSSPPFGTSSSSVSARPFRNPHMPYLRRSLPTGSVESVRFVPYDDVLACGAAEGASFLLVPGAGEPNYDSRVADPYASRKAKREAEVRQLLDKVRPEMISLGGADAVGAVAPLPEEAHKEAQQAREAAKAATLRAQREKADQKGKMKGRNKPTRRHRKKQQNVIEDKREAVLRRMRDQGVASGHAARATREEARARKNAQRERELNKVPRALQRFMPGGEKFL